MQSIKSEGSIVMRTGDRSQKQSASDTLYTCQTSVVKLAKSDLN